MDNKKVKKRKDPAPSFEIREELTRRPLDDFRSHTDPSKSPDKEVLPNIKNDNLHEEDNNDSEDNNEYASEEDVCINQGIRKTVEIRVKCTEEHTSRSRNRKILKAVTSPDIPKHEKNPQSKLSLAEKWRVILVVISVIAIVYAYHVYFKFLAPAPSFSFLDVNAIMSSLSEEFEKQPSMSSRVIQKALKRVNTNEPTAPAIILLLASKGAEDLCHKIAQKLATAVSGNHVNIYGAEYEKVNPLTGKKRIDDVIINTLSEDEYNAVLVENIHLMPGKTAMMFHTYCDHENAPFKRAIYVMTVASGQSIPKDSDPKDWDETAFRSLSSAWNDTGEDQLTPLLVRLTVSVAAITTNY